MKKIRKIIVATIICLVMSTYIVSSIDNNPPKSYVEDFHDITFNENIDKKCNEINIYDNPTLIMNYGSSVQEISDGGYVVVGITGYKDNNSYDYFLNLFLIKTDENGNEAWNKTFDFLSPEFWTTYEILESYDGGFIIAGSTIISNVSNALLLKTDNFGNEEWNLSNPGIAASFASSVFETSDNGIIFSGQTWNPQEPGRETLLCKTDEFGNIEWERTFKITNSSNGGCVKQTEDNGFLITGYGVDVNWSNSLVIDSGILLIKTDEYGNELWNKTYLFFDRSIGVYGEQTNDLGYIVTGYVADENETTYWWDNMMVPLLKTDIFGNIEWYKIFEFDNECIGLSVEQTEDLGYMIGGRTTPTYQEYKPSGFLLKTDNDGIEGWRSLYHGLGWFDLSYATQTDDNGYILVGRTNYDYRSSPDMYYISLVKTDEYGNELWNKTYYNKIPITDLSIGTNQTKLVISNTGEETAYDVKVYINISGGFFKNINNNSKYCYKSITINNIKEISLPKLFGLGLIDIEINVVATNVKPIEKTMKALILFSILILF